MDNSTKLYDVNKNPKKKSGGFLRALKKIGSVCLLVLDCVWHLICVVICINLFLDFFDSKKK